MLDALVLTIGRLVKIVPMLPVAGAAPAKKTARPSSSTFPTSIGLLLGVPVGIVLVVGGLTVSSALALCSVAGHVALRCGVFVGLVVGVGLLVGGLTFFPALILEPGAEYLAAPSAPRS
jgi:K+-transporting ATPase A subunit